MLNGVDPGLHSLADPIDAMRMRCDALAEFGGLFDRDTDLFRVEVRCAGNAVPHEHCARDTQLDEVCAMLYLLTHRLAHFLHAVRDPIHSFVMVRARFADGDEPPGKHQAWAGELPRLDRTAHRELDLVPTTQVAD